MCRAKWDDREAGCSVCITLLGVETHGFRCRKAHVMICGSGIPGGAYLMPSKPKYLLRMRVTISIDTLSSCPLPSAEDWVAILLWNAGCLARAHLHPVTYRVI